MRSTSPTTLVRILAVALPFVVLTSLIAVPAVLTMSTFLALLGLLAALGWVARATYRNGQPAASLAQALHDVDQSGSVKHPRGTR
jgi:hypothetical protein